MDFRLTDHWPHVGCEAQEYAGRVVAVVKEVVEIMFAEGIAPPNNGQGEEAWLALVWQVIENTANNKASMLQDVEAKTPY